MVRRSDEGEAQRRRWTFYEAIMIDRQELGVKTGKGFYTYPNPEYQRADFLKGESD